jgi:hypothetical protein
MEIAERGHYKIVRYGKWAISRCGHRRSACGLRGWERNGGC